MPEASFRFMYSKFKVESGGDERDIMFRLMNYYQAPYMAVLVRCYELGLPETGSIPEELFHVGRECIRERFIDLWLDDSILDATKKDDFIRLKTAVANVGNEYIKGAYLNERILQKVLQNMQALYDGIKGEQ